MNELTSQSTPVAADLQKAARDYAIDHAVGWKTIVYDKDGNSHYDLRDDEEEIYQAFLAGAERAREEFLDKAFDAYCDVCGHYAHNVPSHICRHDCEYYSKFKKYMEEQQ